MFCTSPIFKIEGFGNSEMLSRPHASFLIRAPSVLAGAHHGLLVLAIPKWRAFLQATCGMRFSAIEGNEPTHLCSDQLLLDVVFFSQRQNKDPKPQPLWCM